MSTTRSARFAALSLLPLAIPLAPAAAQPLSIRDIQSNTIDGDASTYGYQVVDCRGGIVIGKFAGNRPRLLVQDPADPGGWGGIQIKDWIYPYDMFNQAQIGDWIELTNFYVEDYRGTTLLQRQTSYDPGFNITTHGLPVPEPLFVEAGTIAAPVYDPLREGWFVEDHDAEPYESMRLIVRDVTVTDMNLGKAADNYNLQNPQGASLWASDYMNADAYPALYHPFVSLGRHFCALTGVLEQYTRLSDDWDYYQFLTLRTEDLAMCGDGDSDGDVDAFDLSRFHECLTGPVCEHLSGGCNPPAWCALPSAWGISHCVMMDLDYDGDVDLGDYARVQRLVSASAAGRR